MEKIKSVFWSLLLTWWICSCGLLIPYHKQPREYPFIGAAFDSKVELEIVLTSKDTVNWVYLEKEFHRFYKPDTVMSISVLDSNKEVTAQYGPEELDQRRSNDISRDKEFWLVCSNGLYLIPIEYHLGGKWMIYVNKVCEDIDSN